jgi:hypothetical protein
MASRIAPISEKIADEPGSPERGHAAWKKAKVERGLAQAKDRNSLIPAEQVWRDLDLEP